MSEVIENWPTFMLHYAWGSSPQAPYRLRGGGRLRIRRATDHVPIIEIFLRKDYGELRDDSVIVDLGASIGTFAIYAATSARNVHVYAYEPMPEAFELMHNNVRLNCLEASVSCFNAAVAADRADRQLYVNGPGLYFPTLVPPAQAASTVMVPCTDLTTILDANRLAHVDLLKMDIEGSEYDVLEHTPRASFERIREIRMEYHNLDRDRRNVERLKRLLLSRQYRIIREQPNTPANGTLWAKRDD